LTQAIICRDNITLNDNGQKYSSYIWPDIPNTYTRHPKTRRNAGNLKK